MSFEFYFFFFFVFFFFFFINCFFFHASSSFGGLSCFYLRNNPIMLEIVMLTCIVECRRSLIIIVSKIQLVVYHQCCVLIG